MKKRILAFLLAGVIAFSNENFISFAMNDSTGGLNVITEGELTETETESSVGEEESITEDIEFDEEESIEEESSTAIEDNTDIESSVEENESIEMESTDESEESLEEETTLETEENKLSEFEYTIENEEVTIVAYKGQRTEVEIPNEIEGYPVTRIGMHAFKDNNILEKVIIPESVTEIGTSAFEGCRKLSGELVLSNNLENIGSYAFYRCTQIMNIILGDNVNSIGDYAFAENVSLKKFILSSNMINIGEGAFYNDISLENITIPKSIENIGKDAFYNSIKEVIFEEGIIVIPDYACYWATKLEKIVVPESVISIGKYTFYNCTSLKEVILGNNVQKVGGKAFSDCSSLEKVTIRDNIIVGDMAFRNCKKIKELNIGNNVTLGNYTFLQSTIIERLSVGVNFREGKEVFGKSIIAGQCGNDLNWSFATDTRELKINGSGTMMNWELQDDVPWHSFKTIIENVEMADRITSIGSYAFSNLERMKYFISPKKIREIGDYAFFSCDNLEYIELSDELIGIGTEAFKACDNAKEIVFCGNAPSFGKECLPDKDSVSIYYPETSVGWNARIFNKYKSASWYKWDVTAPSKDIILVLDKSSSMTWDMFALKYAAKMFVMKVGGRIFNTRISVIAYNTDAHVVSDFTTCNDLLINKIYALEASGSTYYKNALECADTLLENSNADFKSIILFSDGKPSDSETEILDLADTIRRKYTIYTVGLVSDESDKQLLINIAGSEHNYFDAQNVSYLIEAFMKLANDLGKSENTTVEIKRHNRRSNLLIEEQAICIGSPEKVSIIVSPGTKYENVAKVSLVQNDTVILENMLGIFSEIVPGSLFELNQDIYAVLTDAEGNEIEKLLLKLDMREHYVVTYMLNNGTDNVYMAQEVIGGLNFEEPASPIRDGYKFGGWYASSDCVGISFFSYFNKQNLLNIEDDIILYAKWTAEKEVFDLNSDAYSFENINSNFKASYYEISSGDFSKLLSTIDEDNLSEKSKVKEYKNKAWKGSCFGMSSSVCLIKGKEFLISNFDAASLTVGESKLYDNTNGDLDVGNVESMINYYHLRQHLGDIAAIRSDYSTFNQSENLGRIIQKIKTSEFPVVLTISLLKDSWGFSADGHAVVAYGLEEDLENGIYRFQVYDCAIGNGQSYPVIVKKEGNTYSATCEEWERLWNNYNGINFKTALTVEELKREPLLVAPNTINSVATRAIINDTVYNLNTSYSDFTITDGSRSAVIENCKKIDGNLQIECLGAQSGPEANVPDYLFEIPVLTDGTEYTIIPGNASEYNTSMYYDNLTKGFFVSTSSDKSGEIIISETGKITTEFEEMAKYTVVISNNQMKTPWYYIEISGNNTGGSFEVKEDKTIITSAVSSTIDIRVESDSNALIMQQIDVDAGGIEVLNTGNRKCTIQKNGERIQEKEFGYSVVFDSQLGTSVETLQGITEGTLITEPNEPRREGYIFEGWFKENTYENEWNFLTDKIAADTILYAGWSINPNYFVSVTFEVPGKEEQKIYLVKGSKIDLGMCPKIPEDMEQIWYLNDEYTDMWDFENDIVTENIRLFSKGKHYSVSFNTCGAEEIEAITVYSGEVIEEPINVKRDGYTLCGWSIDPAYSLEWDFSSDKVVGDITLYARWIENEKDKNGNDTGICIEILNQDSYVYTGAKVTPKVIVRDGNKVLQAGKDYKINYKNNIDACNAESTSRKDDKKPQIIIQGIGTYKSNNKLIKYFSIRQADLKDLTVLVPEYVAYKANSKLQKVSATVKIEDIPLMSKEYTIVYYTDSALTQQVEGVTKKGIYYVVIEARKDKEGVYVGNCSGKTTPRKIEVLGKTSILSNAKVDIKKKIECSPDISDADSAIREIINKISFGGEVYKTDGVELDLLKQNFVIDAVDTNGKKIFQDNLYVLLKTAGEKTIVIRSKEGNTKGYVGEKRITVTVEGKKLKKSQFKLSFDTDSAKAVTSTIYTGNSMIPSVLTDLELGTDYQVTYMCNNNMVNKNKVKDAGNYVAVITGINQYTGRLTFKFTINKMNLANAYEEGMLSISSDKSAIQTLAGARVPYTVVYDVDGIEQYDYRTIRLNEGTDYTVDYKNNTATTQENNLAYGIIKGKGNFCGILKGDGRQNATGGKAKKGIAKELNFAIDKKDFASEDITVVVEGLEYKKDKVLQVLYKVYDAGKKISSREYQESVEMTGDRITLSIIAKGNNYEGTRHVEIGTDLISVSNKHKVKISLRPGAKYYYTGTQIIPELTICNEEGQDISSKFNVVYGENTDVGWGTVTITGKPECSYCGEKKVKFTILPKWVQWIFQ